MQLIDLSQIIEQSMPLFSPTAPQPKIYPWLSHAQAAHSGSYLGCSCEITEVRFLTSIGTYLESPYHFHPQKTSIEGMELFQCVLPGLVVDCTSFQKRQPITPNAVKAMEISGKAVLFHTGWSQYWGSTEYFDHPYLTQETADVLSQGGARLVGVDCLMIGNNRDNKRTVHVSLLDKEVLIVENLTNLKNLPQTDFTFHAAPVKVSGAATFPVRAYAVLD